MKSFGQILRELRMDRGYSLDQASRRIGISRQYLYMIEKGIRKSPSFENIVSLSEVYEVALDDLKYLMRTSARTGTED